MPVCVMQLLDMFGYYFKALAQSARQTAKRRVEPGEGKGFSPSLHGDFPANMVRKTLNCGNKKNRTAWVSGGDSRGVSRLLFFSRMSPSL